MFSNGRNAPAICNRFGTGSHRNSYSIVQQRECVGRFLPDTRPSDLCRDFSLYVIDNHSPDNSMDRARNSPQRFVFSHGDHRGAGKLGSSQGKQYRDRPSIGRGLRIRVAFEQRHCFGARYFGKIYIGTVETNADMAVPKIYYYGTDLIWQAGGHFTYYNGATAHEGDATKDRGQYDRPRRISYAPTCFMLIRKAVFDEIGLMDERYFVYYDDTDFLWRAKKRIKDNVHTRKQALA